MWYLCECGKRRLRTSSAVSPALPVLWSWWGPASVETLVVAGCHSLRKLRKGPSDSHMGGLQDERVLAGVPKCLFLLAGAVLILK